MFQMVSDTVVHILKASGCRIFPYIDDYVRVASRNDAQRQFRLLHDLLSSLGLPINKDQLNPSSDDLTCLGIQINIPESSLSIDPHKLTVIHQECLHVSTKKFLSKKSFESLMGKLIYVHKCVHPARIFINRILDLFRTKSHKKRIRLTPQFYQDLEWFQKFLPHFNGVTLFKKPIITNLSLVYVDACLSGIGSIWGTRVYLAPAPVVPNFQLKIVHLEMINLVVAFRLWAKHWRHSSIHIYCDNEVVVQVVASSKTKELFLAACIRNIWLLKAIHDVDLRIFHIKGFHNNKADLLWRLYSSKPVHQDLLQELRTTCLWDTVAPCHTNLDLTI